MKQLHLVTAVKTPYLPNGKFDLPAYDRILEQQIANGVEGVIVGGTTGEGQLVRMGVRGWTASLLPGCFRRSPPLALSWHALQASHPLCPQRHLVAIPTS